MVELKAWALEIKARALKQGSITRNELEDATPDWEDDFLEWKNKKERENLLDVMEEEKISIPAFFQLMLFGKWTHPDIKRLEAENKKRIDEIYRQAEAEAAEEEKK